MTKAGALDKFVDQVTDSLRDGSFVRLVLSSPVNGENTTEKVLGRLVNLKTGPHLSVTFRYPTRDTTSNVPVNDAANWLLEQIGVQFRNALLNTTKRDRQLFVPESGTAKLV